MADSYELEHSRDTSDDLFTLSVPAGLSSRVAETYMSESRKAASDRSMSRTSDIGYNTEDSPGYSVVHTGYESNPQCRPEYTRPTASTPSAIQLDYLEQTELDSCMSTPGRFRQMHDWHAVLDDSTVRDSTQLLAPSSRHSEQYVGSESTHRLCSGSGEVRPSPGFGPDYSHGSVLHEAGTHAIDTSMQSDSLGGGSRSRLKIYTSPSQQLGVRSSDSSESRDRHIYSEPNLVKTEPRIGVNTSWSGRSLSDREPSSPPSTFTSRSFGSTSRLGRTFTVNSGTDRRRELSPGNHSYEPSRKDRNVRFSQDPPSYLESPTVGHSTERGYDRSYPRFGTEPLVTQGVSPYPFIGLGATHPCRDRTSFRQPFGNVAYQSPSYRSGQPCKGDTPTHNPGTRERNVYGFLPERDRESSDSGNPTRPHREKEPDRFDGTTVDWKDYIVHFEQVASWNGWSDREKSQQLVMSLRGHAQKLLGDMNTYHLGYWELKDVLSQRFHPPQRETAYRCEFRSRRCAKGESAEDFGFALRRLGCNAYPHMTPSAREICIVDQYITGLGSQDLRRHVQFKHPRSLDEAISFAVEFEAFEGTQGYTRKPQQHKEDEPRVSLYCLQDQPEKSGTKTECITLADITEVVRRECKKLSTNKKQQRDFSNVTCYVCHQLGHLSYDCPTKQQNKLGEQQPTANSEDKQNSTQG